MTKVLVRMEQKKEIEELEGTGMETKRRVKSDSEEKVTEVMKEQSKGSKMDMIEAEQAVRNHEEKISS